MEPSSFQISDKSVIQLETHNPDPFKEVFQPFIDGYTGFNFQSKSQTQRSIASPLVAQGGTNLIPPKILSTSLIMNNL